MEETRSLALLNASEYLPNQLMHGAIGLVVFLVLFLIGSQNKAFWDCTVIRAAACFHLALAVGVLVFKLSSLGPLAQYQLEPLAHMIQELATMGAYSFVAVYMSDKFINVIRRPRLASILSRAHYIYAVCWLIAFTIAIFHRFPMTGLYTELDPWSVPYRAAILVPGIFFCSIFTLMFLERAIIEETDSRMAVTFTLACGGSFVWFLICVEQMSWAVVHALFTPELRDALATPHVVTESLLYSLMGIFWLSTLIVAYGPSRSDQGDWNHWEYQKLAQELGVSLVGIHKLVPKWHTTLDRMRRAAWSLEMSSDDLLKAQKI